VISIKGRKFVIDRLLGEGGFAFVYKVVDPYNSQKFAIKKLLCQTDDSISGAKKELEVFQHFKHRNLLHLLDHEMKQSIRIHGAQELYLLLPLYSQGTLQDVLDAIKTAPDKGFSSKQILTLFLSACNGLKELHSHNPPQCHNDIKPGNMMIGKDELILFDFGSVGAARHQITSRREALVIQEWSDSHCTPLFKAPELFNVTSDAVLDERTDIWAMGCSLYAMMFAYSPFEKDSETGSIALAIESGPKFPEDAYKRYSAELIELVKSLLSIDPTKRPFINELIKNVSKLLSEEDVTVDIQ